MPAERASPTFPPRPSLHGIASRAKRVRLRAPRSRRFFLHGSLLKRSRGAGMETSDISDHLKDAHEHGAEKWVAIYIALLAVLLSVCSIGGGNAAKDSTRTNIQASDTLGLLSSQEHAPDELQARRRGAATAAHRAWPARSHAARRSRKNSPLITQRSRAWRAIRPRARARRSLPPRPRSWKACATPR